jgi:Mg/Co/Ni transporter MgtE
MDRNLARRNIRTGLIVGAIMAVMFGLTFVAAFVYTT